MKEEIPEVELNVENPYALDIIDLREKDSDCFRKIPVRARLRAFLIIDFDGKVIKNRLGYVGNINADEAIENIISFIKWRNSHKPIQGENDWWSCFEENKQNIKNMISYLYQRYDYWDGFPQGITFKELDDLHLNRDLKSMLHILNRIWFAFPKNECVKWPGWHCFEELIYGVYSESRKSDS